MQINPLELYLDKIFADLASRNELEARNIDSMVKLHSGLYSKATGLKTTPAELIRIEQRFNHFYENASSIRSLSNIKDVQSLYKRHSTFNPYQGCSAKQRIDMLFGAFFGNIQEYEKIQVEPDLEQQKIKLDELLSHTEKLDDLFAELYKRKGLVEFRGAIKDSSISLSELYGFAKDFVEEAGKDFIDKLKLKVFKKAAEIIDNGVIRIAAPVEVIARGKQAALGADMMGYLSPGQRVDSIFREFSGFMLLMHDLFPYRGNGHSAAENKEKFSMLLKKSSLTQTDYDLISKVYIHQVEKITAEISSIIEKNLDANSSVSITVSSNNFSEADIRVALSDIQSELDVVEKLLRFNNYHERKENTNINSRILAAALAPALKHSTQNNKAIIKYMVDQYKDIAGISVLSVSEEVRAITIPGSGSGVLADLEYLSRIRPSGDLEKFYYNSPDTNLPTIRAMNGVSDIGNSLVFLVRLATLTEQSVPIKMLAAQDLKSAINVFLEDWSKGDVKMMDVLKSMQPSVSMLHQKFHRFLQKNTLHYSELSESLMKMCSDLSGYDFTSPGGLKQPEALRLMHLVLLSAKHNVLDADITITESAIKALRSNKGLNDQDVAKYVSSVMTKEVLAQIAEYGAMAGKREYAAIDVSKESIESDDIKVVREVKIPVAVDNKP